MRSRLSLGPMRKTSAALFMRSEFRTVRTARQLDKTKQDRQCSGNWTVCSAPRPCSGKRSAALRRILFHRKTLIPPRCAATSPRGGKGPPPRSPHDHRRQPDRRRARGGPQRSRRLLDAVHPQPRLQEAPAARSRAPRTCTITRPRDARFSTRPRRSGAATPATTARPSSRRSSARRPSSTSRRPSSSPIRWRSSSPRASPSSRRPTSITSSSAIPARRPSTRR